MLYMYLYIDIYVYDREIQLIKIVNNVFILILLLYDHISDLYNYLFLFFILYGPLDIFYLLIF